MSESKSRASDFVKGKLTEGQTADSREIQIETFVDEWIIRETSSREIAYRWPRSEIQFESLPGDAARVSCKGFEGASVFVEKDAHLLGESNQLKKTMKKIPIYIVASVVFIVGLYLSLPFVTAKLADQVPLEIEEKIAGELAAVMRKRGSCNSEEVDKILEKITTLLLGENEKREILISRQPRANAFALPGGLVIITSGLLREAETPEEVVGIIGHEFAHVKKRHVMRRVIRQTILTGAWNLTLGDYSGLMLIDPDTIFQIATLKFSRDEEAEADDESVKMLKRAKVSVTGMVDFFGRVADKYPGALTEFDIISTHPKPQSRIDRIQKAAEEQGEVFPPLTPREWVVLKNACAK